MISAFDLLTILVSMMKSTGGVCTTNDLLTESTAEWPVLILPLLIYALEFMNSN